MLIHFAFGSKKENTDEQTELVIKNILKCCKLKYSSACYEFLPRLHYPNSNRYEIVGGPQLVGNMLVFPPFKPPIHREENKHNYKRIDTKRVRYSPEIVPMICFINIPFNKLKNSPHYLNYGKFGIVFGKKFIKKFHPRKVVYYKEDDLFKDEKVMEYNQLLNSPRTDERDKQIKKLSEEILLYRKPYKLWSSFRESVVALVNNNNPKSQLKLTLWQYDRYPEGYDFSKEQEWRISNKQINENDCINFSKEDIEVIIVPDVRSRDKVYNFLVQQNWQRQLKVLLFPS